MKLLQLAFDNLKLLKVKEVKADLSSAPHGRLNGLLLAFHDTSENFPAT